MDPKSEPGSVFNLHALPLWLKHDLWDERKEVPFRGFLFITLYVISSAVFIGILFFPASLIIGGGSLGTISLIWLMASAFFGVPMGLACWWELELAKRKAGACESREESRPTEDEVNKK